MRAVGARSATRSPQGALYRVLDPGGGKQATSLEVIRADGNRPGFHGPYSFASTRAPRGLRAGAARARPCLRRSSTERAGRIGRQAHEARPRTGRAPRRIAVQSDGLYSLSVSEFASALGIRIEAQRGFRTVLPAHERRWRHSWTSSSDGAQLLF
jgi:hypothetical protein